MHIHGMLLMVQFTSNSSSTLKHKVGSRGTIIELGMINH